MQQPESLRTDEYLPWCRGRGNDVWGMMQAASTGDLATLESLVAKDVSLVDCEFEYYRPLHFAVRDNQFEAVRWLIDHGADPFCGFLGYQPPYRPQNPGNHQWSFTMARERGYTDILALLEAHVWNKFRMHPDGELLPALIRDRHVAGVVQTLDARPELIGYADGFGNHPLHWAVITRQLPLIDLLLARGADINAARPDGACPLDLTNGDYHFRGWRDVPRWTLRPHEVLIGYLLARGAYYDISTAAQLGDLERVRTLLDERPELANRIPTSSGYYNGAPLRCAAAGGHLDVVKLLLERGADPNLPECVAPRGAALYEAIAGKHWELVKLLIAHGADATGAVESSGNCYWRAKNMEHAPEEILRLLASKGGGLDLELACHDNDLEALSAMLLANPQFHVWDHLDTDDEAALELVMRYQPDVLTRTHFRGAKSIAHARWLFEHGMDAKQPNWLGITPLHRAALAGNVELADLLVEFGADVNAIDDEFSSTPLGWAARAGQGSAAQWLLDHGADATLPHDKVWARPIAWAARRGASSITDP